MGTRAAATAMVELVDAAASPKPEPVARPGQTGRNPLPAAVPARTSVAAIRRGGKGLGRALWGPAARAGGVLWYELTGVFFGLFALAAGAEVWKHRFDLRAPGAEREKALFAVVMLLAFGWFTVSSFSKARRRAHRG